MTKIYVLSHNNTKFLALNEAEGLSLVTDRAFATLFTGSEAAKLLEVLEERDKQWHAVLYEKYAVGFQDDDEFDFSKFQIVFYNGYSLKEQPQQPYLIFERNCENLKVHYRTYDEAHEIAVALRRLTNEDWKVFKL